jgi:phage gp36-like protein
VITPEQAMTYTTQQNFTDAFGQAEILALTNLHDPTASGINTAALSQNQRKAFALINSAIAKCPGIAVLMPFSTPYPELLVGLELDLTRYFLDSISARPDVRKRYEDALDQLRLISTCELSLGLNSSNEVANNSDKPTYAADRPVFSSAQLSDYVD